MASTDGIQNIITASKTNITALNTIVAPTWVSAPSVRGTSAILWSCITTLVACVYTALHLNVPADTGTWAMLRLKASWVLVALLAPEIVVYMAISQLFAAWRLRNGLNELVDDDSIDLTYCFFVVMGGVEVRNIQPFASRRNQRPFLPISPETMLWLAKLGHRIRIEPKRINDKSKADAIQKCLVLFQATWMAVQCITRRAYGLPLTLLEVHTMVHVLCAAIIYAFWLKKPLDVREPERLDYEGWEDVLALLSERAFPSEHGDLVVIPKMSPQSQNGSTAIQVVLPDRTDLRKLLDTQRRVNKQELEDLGYRPATEPRQSLPPRRSSSPVRIDWQLSDFDPAGLLDVNKALPCGLANVGRPIDFTPELVRYWNLVMRGLDSAQGVSAFKPRTKAVWLYQALFEAVTEPSPDNSNFQFPLTDLLIMDHFPVDRSLRHRQFYVAMILPAIYGGIHLSAASFDFPSRTESQLWLYSGLYIALGLPIWEVMAWFMAVYESTGMLDMLLRPCCDANGLHRMIWRFTRSILGRLFLLGYALARTYIIVESFASLRHVPIGVYWTPDWLEMIPHI